MCLHIAYCRHTRGGRLWVNKTPWIVKKGFTTKIECFCRHYNGQFLFYTYNERFPFNASRLACLPCSLLFVYYTCRLLQVNNECRTSCCLHDTAKYVFFSKQFCAFIYWCWEKCHFFRKFKQNSRRRSKKFHKPTLYYYILLSINLKVLIAASSSLHSIIEKPFSSHRRHNFNSDWVHKKWMNKWSKYWNSFGCHVSNDRNNKLRAIGKYCLYRKFDIVCSICRARIHHCTWWTDSKPIIFQK